MKFTGKLFRFASLFFFTFALPLVGRPAVSNPSTPDLSDATILVRPGDVPVAEKTAAEILREEIERRTGLRLDIGSKWPDPPSPAVVVVSGAVRTLDGRPVPHRSGSHLPEHLPEGYRLFVESTGEGTPIVWILGADPRGAIYGVGEFLRQMRWSAGSLRISVPLDHATAPAYPIRGHQLGYRNTSNSYDAWTPEIYEQYVRELALFGANCIENIPFQDGDPSPHMPIPREEMNVRLGAICLKYDIDYWVWTPATFPLTDQEKRKALLARHVAFYEKTPRLDGVFFPGGDPGNNPPDLVLPFLKELAAELKKRHPDAGVWMSMQGFEPEEVEYVYRFLREKKPDWLAGIVGGPSSPPLEEMRKKIPPKYRIRQYPDITHTVRCQYPVEWWDPAFSLTLGREPINPQPVYYALLCNYFTPYSDGFLTYSDGVNDDVNKMIWSQCGWTPHRPVRDILIEYSRFFFGPDVAEEAADGILALEKNWIGSLAENGSVATTLRHWQTLDRQHPELRSNWRWVSCLYRAYYDSYIRRRLIRETRLEQTAHQILAEAGDIGADPAMDQALKVLTETPVPARLRSMRKTIFELGDALHELIGMQLSVERHQASGAERGCTLQFLDHPLNNLWWIEDQFKEIRLLSSEKEKLERLRLIATWENPGPGSFYDDLGNIAKSSHVIRGEDLNTDPLMEKDPNPGYWWWNQGMSRRRLSWQVTMDGIIGMRYVNLDPEGDYLIRITGQRESLLRIDGKRVEPTRYSLEIGEFKEFPVPRSALEDGVLELTWDWPDESHLNWRQTSHLAEIWLLKK